MEISKLSLITDAVFHWLNYANTVSKTEILAESSIRYPLAECVERKLGLPVSLEVNHPYYDGHRIDFQIIDNGIENNIELKFLRSNSSGTSERRRFLFDLIRLATLDTNSTRNYFMLCGSMRFYKSLFEPLSFNTINKSIPASNDAQRKKYKSDIYCKWFPQSDDNVSRLSLDECREYSEAFRHAYNSPFPSGCIELLLKNKRVSESDRGNVVLLWKVNGNVI